MRCCSSAAFVTGCCCTSAMTIARREALLGRRRIRVDAGDQHAFHFFLDLVLLAQLVGQVGEIEAERFLARPAFLPASNPSLESSARLLLLVLQAAELDGLLVFLALADDDDFHVLADRRIGNDLAAGRAFP